MYGFKLNGIGQGEFPECHGEGANAALSELCVGKRMRDLNPRVCENPRLFDKSPLRICQRRFTMTDASQRICLHTDLLDDPNVAQGICMNGTR